MSQTSITFVFMALAIVSVAIISSLVLSIMEWRDLNKNTTAKNARTLALSSVIANGVGIVAIGITWIIVIYHHNVLTVSLRDYKILH